MIKDSRTHVVLSKVPYYVISVDRGMSGWGDMKGKINKCIVPCDTFDQAESVVRYIESRTDQEDIEIVEGEPSIEPNVEYSIVIGWLRKARTLDSECNY